MSRYASSTASALIGAALCLVAFVGGGGFDLARSTWVEIGMVAIGGVLVAAAVVRGRRGRIDGGFTLLAFGALTLLCALSVLWSVAPHQSWLATNLTLGYLAVFAGGIAIARLTPDGVTAVLRGILLAAGVIVGYALITRVYPALAADEVFARLGQPYGYWNALGTTAALAVPAALWLGSRRSGHQPVNALAYPLLSLALVALFLSYSRGAMVMAGIGAALWLAFVPLRLRSITLLGVSLAGAAPVIVWALAQDAFTKNYAARGVREAVATEFGLWLIATVVVMLGAGLAIGFRVARRPPRAPARLRVGVVATAVAVVVPVVLLVVLANSDRGLGGTITQGYESLTSISKKTPSGPARLLTASSSRGLYWHQAKEVFLSHYWKGTGAETFGVARLHYRAPDDRSLSRHAHGYVHETAANLGTIGLVVSLVLLIAWLVAARRATGVLGWRRDRVREFGPERVGMIALGLCALVYGMHSAVDWVWYVPGPTVMALLAAGFVAGRGPLARRRDAVALPRLSDLPPPLPARTGNDGSGNGASAAQPAARSGDGVGLRRPALPVGASATATAPVAAPAARAEGSPAAASPGTDRPRHTDPSVGPPPPPPPPRTGRRLPPAAGRSVRPLVAGLALVAAALTAWAIWQPLRSDRESDRALDLAADNRIDAARAAAERAHEIDPLTPRPYAVLSALEDGLGHPRAALGALERAVTDFPGDPQTWLQLAQYQLNSLSKPADAIRTIKGALYLDPQSRAAQTVFFQASTALNPAVPPPVLLPGSAPAPTPAPTPPPAANQSVPTAPAPPAPGTGGTAPP